MRIRIAHKILNIVIIFLLAGCSTINDNTAPIETTDQYYQKMTQEKQTKYVKVHPCLRKLSETPYIVLFENGKTTIPAKYHQNLDEAANCLKAHKHIMVLVNGFASQKGNPNFNALLSEQRAKNIRAALIARGVDPHNIITHGYGIAVKHIPKQHDPKTIEAFNRRVNLTPIELTEIIVM